MKTFQQFMEQVTPKHYDKIPVTIDDAITNRIRTLDMIDKSIAKERLTLIQEKLFSNQIEINKSMENQIIDVLVENKMEKQNKFFGRNKYITPVIFDGNDNQIGKNIKVKIQTSNQNTLFGSAIKNMKAA